MNTHCLPMKTIAKILFVALLAVRAALAAPNAADILAASDAIRNPGKPFSVIVTLTEFQAGKQVDASTLTS